MSGEKRDLLVLHCGGCIVAKSWRKLTHDDTGGLMTGNQRELGNELALVNVKVGTADTA